MLEKAAKYITIGSVLQAVWFALVVWVYVDFILGWMNSANPELGQAMMIKLLYLAGPACYISLVLLWLIGQLIGVWIKLGPLAEWTMLWVLSVVAGYLQWFIVLPIAFKGFRGWIKKS